MSMCLFALAVVLVGISVFLCFYKKTFFIFVKTHPFLFIACLLSAFLWGIQCVFFIEYGFPYSLLCFLLFIPVLLVFLIAYFSQKTFTKYPNLTRLISFLLNILILLIIQLCGVMYFFIAYSGSIFSVCDKPSCYQKTLKNHCFENVRHFPVKIPVEAKDVQFYAAYNPFWNPEYMVLKFTVDDNYINEKINIYNNSGFRSGYFYSGVMPFFETYKIYTPKYKFYMFPGYKGREYMFNEYGGIAIDNKNHTIVYFYVSE